MSKKNAKEVAFQSGRKVGHSEAVNALRNVLYAARRGELRNCHPGCFEEDLISRVSARLRADGC